jgi:hypothetical protein
LGAFNEVVKGLPEKERTRLFDRYLSAYHAYLRVSGVESGSVSCGSGKSAGSSSVGSAGVSGRGKFPRKLPVVPPSLTTRRFARSGAEVEAVVVPKIQPQGFCYLEAFREASRSEVAQELGPKPTFFSIMAQPRSRFRPEEELVNLTVKEIAGVHHLEKAGEGKSFLGVMRALAAKSVPSTLPDSIWHDLRCAVGVPTTIRASQQLAGDRSLVGNESLQRLFAVARDKQCLWRSNSLSELPAGNALKLVVMYHSEVLELQERYAMHMRTGKVASIVCVDDLDDPCLHMVLVRGTPKAKQDPLGKYVDAEMLSTVLSYVSSSGSFTYMSDDLSVTSRFFSYLSGQAWMREGEKLVTVRGLSSTAVSEFVADKAALWPLVHVSGAVTLLKPVLSSIDLGRVGKYVGASAALRSGREFRDQFSRFFESAFYGRSFVAYMELFDDDHIFQDVLEKERF